VQRYAFAPLIVNSPPAQTVDGGATGSAGALGGWFLAALAGLAGFRRRRRLQQPAVH
jgi:MYXO-CTERM domain-containing protein